MHYVDRADFVHPKHEKSAPWRSCLRCAARPRLSRTPRRLLSPSLHLARRKGYARLLVECALHTLALRQCIPRYQVHEDNHASIRLAETIGLRWFVTMEHWSA